MDETWTAPWRDEQEKFDIQFKQGAIGERQVAELFTTRKIEVKTETHIWERSGNIAIEYRSNGKPSGIAVTEAEYWVHVLKFEDGGIAMMVAVPIARLKQLAREAIRAGRCHVKAGDGGRQKLALVRLRDLYGPARDFVSHETGAR